MDRWFRTAAWVFLGLTIYVIVAGGLEPRVHLPGVGDVGFTVAMVLFTLFHCAALEGMRRTGVFFTISAVVSWGMEEIGVRTGLIYGAYHYSDRLGLKLGQVPILIPLAWFMMIYPSWMVARAMLRGVDTRRVGGITALAAVAALVMTAWDVVMDPGMAAAGNWVWEHGGAYFGVPRRNYLGWLLTTFLVYWIAGWVWRETEQGRRVTRTFDALPILVYALFALRYMTSNTMPALQVVAVFSMGIPGFVALMQAYLNKSETGV